jgi:hypothetical protein
MKKKIFINGYEWWIDETNNTLSGTENGTATKFEHIHFTQKERQQINRQLYYNHNTYATV